MVTKLTSSESKPHIEANIKGLGNDTILISYFPMAKMGEMEKPLTDTTLSKNGRFALSLPINEPALVYLFPKKGEFIRISGRPFHPDQKYIVLLVKPTDILNISGELKKYYIDYQVQGSEFNEQYAQVRKSYIEATSEAVAIELELDTLQAKDGNKEEINALFKKRNEIESAARIAHFEYIKSNLDKDLSAFYLIRQPWEILDKYYNELSLNVKNGVFKNVLESEYTRFQKYTKAKEAELKIKEGESAPDFLLSSLSGNFSLNSVKNKYIVLDFWGSWCPPCIKGFPKMKEYYSQYHDKLEIVGIDCNETEENWRKAIQKHELPWLQVINNKDIDSDISVKYGIQAFPTKFILDKDRKIIARFVGEDDAFYNKLDELLKQN